MLSFTISPQVASTPNMQLHYHKINQKEVQRILWPFSHYSHTMCESMGGGLKVCAQFQHFACEKPQMLTLDCF